MLTASGDERPTHWLVDARGCDPAALRDRPALEALLDELVRERGLTVVGEPRWQQFPSPGGITALYLLAESHLALHTWPEHGWAAFDLFLCRPRLPWRWDNALRAHLGASHVSVRCVRRGEADVEPATGPGEAPR